MGKKTKKKIDELRDEVAQLDNSVTYLHSRVNEAGFSRPLISLRFNTGFWRDAAIGVVAATSAVAGWVYILVETKIL